MPKVNREEFLRHLEAVEPGLSKRDLVEQSSCVVFTAGVMTTYNEEVCCRAKSPLNGVVGAVAAAPLMALLRKMPDDVVTVTCENKVMRVLGGGRRELRVRMDAEITLPVGSVERPKKEDWRPVPEGFFDAVSLVEQCAGKDQAEKGLTCVHIHPKWVEACDRMQLARYAVKTGVAQPIMVPRDSLKGCLSLDMTRMAETEAWVHFRNPTGLVYSCLRYLEPYPDLLKYIQDAKRGAKPLTLPLGMAEVISRAEEVVRDQDEKEKQVLVELKAGRVRLRGIGVKAEYREWQKAKYHGPDLAFLINPKLMTEITARHTECTINAASLRIDGGRWVYVTSLGSPEEKRAAAEDTAEKAEPHDEPKGEE